jgi:hypothetical protein
VSDALVTLRSGSVNCRHAELMAEPTGAIGLDRVLHESLPFQGQTVATIIRSGNVISALMRVWLDKAG